MEIRWMTGIRDLERAVAELEERNDSDEPDNLAELILQEFSDDH